jgi:hypothetical protein
MTRRPRNAFPVIRFSIAESTLLRAAYEAELAGKAETYVGEAAEKLAKRGFMMAVSADEGSGATYALNDAGRARAAQAAEFRAALAAR